MDENKGFAVGTKKCGLLCGAIGALAALCWVLFGFSEHDLHRGDVCRRVFRRRVRP